MQELFERTLDAYINEEQSGDPRYLLGQVVNMTHKVVWQKESENMFMVVPHHNKFGRDIYSFDMSKPKGEKIRLLSKDIDQTKVLSSIDELPKAEKYSYCSLFNGITIRMFHNGIEWKYATSSTLDAGNTYCYTTNRTITGKIAPKQTILQMFNKFTVDCSVFDKNLTHFFSFYLPDCINVVPYGDKPICVYLGSSDKEQFVSAGLTEGTLEDIKNLLNGAKCGALIKSPDNKLYIVHSQYYKDLYAMIKNVNNIQYISLMNLKNKDKFIREYPFWESCMKYTVSKVHTLAKNIKNLFTSYFFTGPNRNKCKNKAYLPILYQLYARYLVTKKKMTLLDIQNFLINDVDTSVLACALGISIKIRTNRHLINNN